MIKCKHIVLILRIWTQGLLNLMKSAKPMTNYTRNTIVWHYRMRYIVYLTCNITNKKRYFKLLSNERQKLQTKSDSLARELTFTQRELERYQREHHTLTLQV
jgi:hypothetical protein